MYKIIFTISQAGFLDPWYIECFQCANWDEVKAKLISSIMLDKPQEDSFIDAYHYMDLRTRFDNKSWGPYCINSEEPLDRETLKQYLESFSTNRLKEFLAESKI